MCVLVRFACALDMEIIWLCECGAFALFVSICSVVGFDYFVSIVLLIFFIFSSGVLFLQYAGVE